MIEEDELYPNGKLFKENHEGHGVEGRAQGSGRDDDKGEDVH